MKVIIVFIKLQSKVEAVVFVCDCYDRSYFAYMAIQCIDTTAFGIYDANATADFYLSVFRDSNCIAPVREPSCILITIAGRKYG